nr:MAG TPA: hypothetical protein [Caudoviricetes sp.]
MLGESSPHRESLRGFTRKSRYQFFPGLAAQAHRVSRTMVMSMSAWMSWSGLSAALSAQRRR